MSKAKKIIICFLGACLVAFTVITASATETHYFVFSKPDVSSSACYLECVSANGWKFGLYVVGVQILSNWTDSNNVNIKPSPALTYRARYIGDYLEITSVENPVGTNFYGYFINFDGSTFELDSTSGGRKFFIKNSGKLSYVHGYNCDTSPLNTSGDFIVSYGNDWDVVNKLNAINATIESFKGQNQEELKRILQAIISQGNSNTQQLKDNADKNASNIQSNNDKNTQSIIDNQNQLVQQEKTDTQNSADNSVSDVSGSVPDKSAGMLSALQSLSNAVSYTGTTAKWTFPQMYIPAISGVTDRINLNSAMQIDFSYWVNQIPQDIRTVISAIATIGLVIFAFKELYGLISYVLTLKGGGNNE